MIGAIAGDVIGSVHEFLRGKTMEFPLFDRYTTYTDDTVLTIAVAAALLDGRDYATVFREFCHRHPGRGYGGMFQRWIHDRAMGPYGSFGNGSAMRVSPVAWLRGSEAEVLEEARRSAAVTHDHPEGVRGAEATALAVFLAAHEADKDEIRRRVTAHSGYRLDRSVDEIRPTYEFNETCFRTVPEALQCFLEGRDWEHAVRLAISLGGDADTLACITGSIAEAHYGGVPGPIVAETRRRLAPDLIEVLDRFEERRGVRP